MHEVKFFKRAISRMAGFSASVALSGVVSVASIPFLIAVGGESGWLSIAVGQSVGTVCGLLTSLGYGVTGPSDVAIADKSSRYPLFVDSLYIRIPTLAATIPVAFVVSIYLAPDGQIVAGLSAINWVLLSMGAKWFFVGIGNPRSLLFCDTLPFVVGSVGGIVGSLLSQNLLFFSFSQMSGILASIFISSIWIRNKYLPLCASVDRFSVTRFRAQIVDQVPGSLTQLLGSVYILSPLLLLTLIHPGGASSFALGDKLRQQSIQAASPIVQAVQGWTPKGGDAELLRRTSKAAIAALFFGCLSFGVFAVLAPGASGLLGGGAVVLGFDISIPLGIAFGLNVVSFMVGVSCLVPVGGRTAMAQSAAGGAVAALLFVVPLTIIFSAEGTAWGAALVQFIVVSWQFWKFRLLRIAYTRSQWERHRLAVPGLFTE